MGNSIVQFVFLLMTLLLGAGAESVLPQCFGVGFPVLLVAVHALSTRLPIVAVALFALSAGFAEDALSGLPTMTSASYFLAAAFLSRFVEARALPVLLTYPVYQVWLAIWAGGIGAGIYGRLLLSLPIGVLTALVTIPIMVFVERKAALGEQS